MPLQEVFGQVNVIGGTVPTLIVGEMTNRSTLQINNNGAATVYLGGAAVTVNNGYPVATGEDFIADGPGAVYGIVASGTIDVRYHYSA